MNFIPLPFYQLNRLRGTYSYFAKINSILLGLIFGYASKNPYIGTAVAVGYLAGESMGWGDWIGQLVDNYERCGNEGQKNGIKWLSSKLFPCGTRNYNICALAIRGVYWWLPALASLAFVVDYTFIIVAVIILGIGFPASVLLAKGSGKPRWNRAEYIYGGIQDLVLWPLAFGVYYA